ncbi:MULTISPECIES: TonB-dependent receptor [Acidobacteriaceae]|uniref:TonB-dependent receptor n=1 Tax=Acidobacteriaceae TaxID=204434 RepID=UPI00131C0D3F|nr:MULTISPECIES: TonB-dependent receptor [Acidobacteriaceae]MDW5267336.1 TonB-dependent receptor [Edaphobacter sp.]
MHRSIPSLLSLIALSFLLLVTGALAQGTSGNITGSVTDTTGAVISSAVVTIQNPISGYKQTTQTDANGQYHFDNLPFNRYHMSVVVEGFQSTTNDTMLRSASNTVVNFQLSVASSSQSVTVDAEASDMVNNDPTSATQVDRSLFARLPTESTSAPLSSLVTLSTPGIASDSNGLFHPMGEHADTTYSIDGQPVSDQQSRVFGNQLSLNAIQSINVIDGIAPPEYGDKASLVVQTTTRSGLGLPHPTGSLSFNYGSFGTSNGSAALGFGNQRLGNFSSFDAVDSGRYLDTPEQQPLHAHGNNENFFDRIDYHPTQADSLQLNLSASRSWFQNPNQYDQQALGQDQRGEIFSYNIAPSWTHIINPNSLIDINPYLRQDDFHYYPSKDPFSDTPATLAQSRRLQNAGLKVDYSYSRGIHSFKVGAMFYHTFLDESFSLGITDPAFNAPCLDANGAPDTNADANDPNNCPVGDTSNPSYITGTGAYDLTRGGSLYHFKGHTDIKQEAVYLQDNIVWKNWTFLLGGRVDNYNGLSSRSMVEPRLGGTYTVRSTNTVLRLGYGKLFLTPYNENLIVSSSTGIGGLEGAGAAVALKPAARNQYDAGFEQGFGKHLVVNGEYFWKYTNRDYDFDVLLNTPLAFPIQWQKSKIDGFGIKVTMPTTHGVSAYSVLGHTRSRFFGPEVGGILFNDSPVPAGVPFRIDHDQAFQQSTHMQYQPKPRGPWYGITWRYESGLVAGNAPIDNGQTPTDLTYLTADQQSQILLRCGDVQATRTAPLTSCPTGELSSPLLSLPKPGTENDDRNPPRVAPRTMFDMAAGWDNILRRERFKTNLSVTAVNVTNKYALYNFLSTFSGTHFVSPRTVNGQVTLSF